MEGPLLIRNARLIDPAGGLDRVGDLLIRDGRIAAMGGSSEETTLPPETRVIDATGWVACPGFIDLHCHLREPGQEDKETIATGTLAAARGGFTTVCCMPNTQPPIDSAATLEFVVQQAQREGHVRVYPIGCVTRHREGKELAELRELAEAGVVGFSDDGSPVWDASMMRMALTYSRGLGVPIINHCEEPGLSKGGTMHEGWVSNRLGLPGYPAAAEESMVARDIALAELTGGRLHLAHVTTAAAMEMVRWAKGRGLAVTAEVTPHHLTMSEEWALGLQNEGDPYSPLTPMAYDARTKVNPPLRTRRDAEALVEGLKQGIIDVIATDHAPHCYTDKEVTYDDASMGISVLETALGSLAGLVHQGKLDIVTLVHRLTVAPSRVLEDRFKDLVTLAPDTPADVVVFDPNEEWRVEAAKFASKGKNTPLDGCTLKGRVKLTLVGGKVVHDEADVGSTG